MYLSVKPTNHVAAAVESRHHAYGAYPPHVRYPGDASRDSSFIAGDGMAQQKVFPVSDPF